MKLGERIWTEIPELTKKVVVVPLGSLEQHGHHLPMLTDTMIGTEIARRAEEELGEEALFTPTLWVGASDHHRAMPGTVSISNPIYVQVISCILESLIGGGFRRIFLLNAHGGNITPGRMALYDVQLRHKDKPDLFMAFSSWWTIAADQIAELEGFESRSVTHACGMETSQILRLRPELVKMDRAKGTNIPFESAFYVPDFNRPSRVDIPRTFDQLSATGAFGHPEIATPEKGELLFETATKEVVAFVREFGTWDVIPPQ